MFGKRPRTIGAVAAMGLVVAGIVAASGHSASGQIVIGPTTAQRAAVDATLIVELTDRAGVVKLVFDGDTDGSDTISQQIATGSACPTLELTPLPGGGNLLDFVPVVAEPGGTVQLPGNYMGVNSGTSCGTPAGQIGPGEQLRIELGGYFGPEVKATSAQLAIRRTNRADGDLLLQFLDANNAPDTVRQIPITRNGTSTVDTTAMGSGIALAPTDGFYGVVLASTSSSNSRGLSVTTVTSFELDGLLSANVYDTDCGERISKEGGDGAIADSVEFFRGENDPTKNAEIPCAEVEATVEIITNGPEIATGVNDWVYWDNSILDADGNPQAVNGTVTINWAPIPVAESARLDRKIDYDGLGPGGFSDTLWCLSFDKTVVPSAVEGEPEVTFDVELPDYTGPGAITVAGVQKAPWCLVSDERVVQADGTIIQSEVLFGSGDPGRW